MQNKLIALTAILVLVVGNAVVWFSRPTAKPAYPSDIVFDQSQAADKKQAPPAIAKTAQKAPPTKPKIVVKKPLTVSPEPVVPIDPEGDQPATVEQSPHLAVGVEPKGSAPAGTQ